MNLTKEIAEMIISMLDADNSAEIQRNLLAEQIGCAKSQINYVISSRFTPEHGYIVESHRGGGGYIKITKASENIETLKMHLINSIGSEIGEKTLRANIINLHDRELLTESEAKMILAATSEYAFRQIPIEYRNILRAGVLKQMLLATEK
ncbi:MAG: CtsR family transcriptional regulator [Oscillospiraceae bacterium]